MIKKIIACLMAIMLMLTNVPLSALAAENVVTLTVDTVIANNEEYVSVPIRISNNTGVCGASISVTYGVGLTLTDISQGTALGTLTMTKPGRYSSNPINIVWDGLEEDNSNGIIAVLTFKVPESEGTYPVSVSYRAGDILDGDLNSVDVKVVNGSVKKEAEEILPTSVGLDRASVSMKVGEAVTLRAMVAPSNAVNKTVTWKSGNTAVATVANGVVTAKAAGTATITVTTVNGKTATAVITVTAPAAEKELPFKDVPKGSWYYDSVKEVYELGIMTGNSAGTLFTPDGVMTRGMIVNVLYRLDGSPKTTYQAGFKDVDAKKYYATSVNWAVKNGIVKGYSDNTFRPDNEITREQMVIILYYYAKYLGMDMSKTADLSIYKDSAKINSYGMAPVKWAVANGIMSGSSSKQLNPQQTVTRAQAARMLAEFNHLKVAAGK